MEHSDDISLNLEIHHFQLQNIIGNNYHERYKFLKSHSIFSKCRSKSTIDRCLPFLTCSFTDEKDGNFTLFFLFLIEIYYPYIHTDKS